VHIDHENARIVMYFHGLESFGKQLTRVATSRDGIHFDARLELLGRSYWRVFSHGGYTYALAMPGQLYRSRDPLSGFKAGPLLFDQDMRHAALLKKDDTLLSDDWKSWKETDAEEILRPETDWEGADAPLEPSVRSVAYGHVNQLRDPAIYLEDDDVYLLYAVAGENGIAIAQLHFNQDQ
jgi:hypothetical protein